MTMAPLPMGYHWRSQPMNPMALERHWRNGAAREGRPAQNPQTPS
jgi:hypothetical protein